MNRREFAKLGVAAGALGLGGFPLGLQRAVGQTKGGRLNAIIQPEPPMLVSALSQLQATLTVAGKLYESLLRYDFDLKPMPGLAKSWEVSADGLTYTFKLHPNITFHDGKPLTADDVIFSLTKMLPETHARARGVFSRIASSEAPDPLTVVFKLKAPFAPFLGALDCTTAPVLPKHIYDGTNYRENPANAQAIGCGPFKLKEWVRGSHIHFVKHEGYYRAGEPHIDEIIYRVIPDAASRAVALEQGNVQLTQWSDIEMFDFPRMSKLPTVDVTTKGYEMFAPHLWLELNNRVAPMNDKRFRQAVMYAIDRKALQQRLYFGLGKIATGPVSSKTRFYEKDVKLYEYSQDKAKALLDEMGLKPGPDGKRISIPFLFIPSGDIYRRMAEFLKQTLLRVGIELQFETTDTAGWIDRVANWNFAMTNNLVYQLGDPAIGVSRSYISSNIRKGIMFSNTAGYANPEVDRLFEEAAVAGSDAKRQELYSAVQKILGEDVPIVWLLEQDFPTITNKKVKNVTTTGIGVHETFGAVTIEG